MSDNLPPDFREDMREHYPRCASLCDYADTPLDIDKGIDAFIGIASDMSWWRPSTFYTSASTILATFQARLNEAAALVECLNGHRDHTCNCEDIANSGDPWDEGDGE